MSKKPTCPTCERVLFNRIYDRCMYCGASLPSELLLTQEEKEPLIRKEKERQELEKKATQPKFVKEFYIDQWIGED